MTGQVDRARMEAREREVLAPYAAKSADSRGRRHPEPEHAYRTVFQRDRDRIVHSTAFRRLEYKTQVFVNHEGDYYRTRLTHTMEVAQIARTVARALGLNEDLTEAVALSHDLGHPPFGHSGENVLDALVRRADLDPEAEPVRFEHNRQSLRVVDDLERRYPDFPGLNLSYEVRESIALHARESAGNRASDTKTLVGIDVTAEPLLEAQVVDVCDSVAYHNHDIDDGLKAGLLDFDILEGSNLWQVAREAARDSLAGLPRRHRRYPIVRRLIDRLVTDLIEESLRRIAAAGVDSPDAVRRAGGPLIGFSNDVARGKRELHALLHRELYGHHRVRKMQIKSQSFLEKLYLSYWKHPVQLPPQFQRSIGESGKKRVIVDYLAGMTDRFAHDEYRRMFEPFERI